MAVDTKKYLDAEGLSYLWSKIKTYVGETIESGTSDTANKIHFVVPNEKEATEALTATISDINALSPGLAIALRMPFDSIASQTLNINSLGAKPIYYQSSNTDAGKFPSGAVVFLVYETTSIATGCFKAVYSYDGAQPSIYQGATASSAGTAGLVPAAASAQKDNFLKGDGTWAEVTFPSMLTATEVQTGTDTTGKLISAKVLHDYATASNTDTKVNVTLGTTTKAYILGTSTTPSSTATGVTAVSDTEVYLDTTAGRLTAASFAGNVENGTLATANAVVVTNASKKLTASTTITTTELGYLNGVTSSIQDQLDGKAASSHNHDASNITSGTLDAARLPSIDASKITTGTIDIARLPAGALERLVTVADQTARFALSSSDVQLGDTVRQSDTGLMYYVVDTSKLNSEAGYAEYTAGSATSVPWSGITSKPSTYAPSAHNQASNTINAMTGYSKPSSTSAIAATDTLNSAIGKLEKALDGKQASGTYLTPSSTLDATKLSGTIPSECYTDTIYTHPTTSGNKHIPSGGSSGQFLGWSADGTAAWVGNPNWTTHLYAGAASNSTANATSATTNAATYIVVCDNSSARNAVQITGSNGTTVSAVNGKLTIDSPALAAVTTSQIDTLFA